MLTYGGNLRFNRFELTIAPGEDSRTEGGAYIQDEFLIDAWMRLVAGARVDKFSSIDNAVFSPRVAVVFKPQADQSIRVTYNRAFRAPSMVNNNLDTTIATPLPLGVINPAYGSAIYYVPTAAVGNPDLTEEHIDAFEIAYTAHVRDRATVSAAWYYNNFSDQILFTQVAEWGPRAAAARIPGARSGARRADLGRDLRVRHPIPEPVHLRRTSARSRARASSSASTARSRRSVTAFVNYSYQADPIPTFPGLTEEQALQEINLPSNHLFNIGVTLHGRERVRHALGQPRVRRVLAGRARRALPRHDRGLHVGEPDGRLKFGGRYAVALKITESRQPADSAAHLRRHHEAAGHRRVPCAFPK